MKPLSRSLLPWVLASLVIGTALWLVLRGIGWGPLQYYALDRVDRPFHPSHDVLRSSGRLGLLFGVAGTALMVLNLSYLLRKRLLGIAWLGPLRSWMGLHVLTGLVGPALIVLHSGLAPSSALGTLAFTAMGIVVAAGLVGRTIYAVVPRSVEGRELRLEEVRRELDAHRQELERLGIDPSIIRPGPAAAPDGEPAGFLRALRASILGGIEGRREMRRLRAAILSSPELGPRAATVLPLIRKMVRTQGWIDRYRELRMLMGSWRFFHRWLAIVMLLVVVFHVIVAVRFGDLWILEGLR